MPKSVPVVSLEATVTAMLAVEPPRFSTFTEKKTLVWFEHTIWLAAGGVTTMLGRGMTATVEVAVLSPRQSAAKPATADTDTLKPAEGQPEPSGLVQVTEMVVPLGTAG